MLGVLTNWLGVSTNGTVLFCDGSDDGKQKAIALTTLRLLHETTVIRTLPVPYPDTGMLTDLHPSPDGKQLAWLLAHGAVRRKGEIYPSPQRATLYVSTVEGHAARAVGTLPFQDSMDDATTVLHGWFPDAKQVLLEFRHQLFAVPLPALSAVPRETGRR